MMVNKKVFAIPGTLCDYLKKNKTLVFKTVDSCTIQLWDVHSLV